VTPVTRDYRRQISRFSLLSILFQRCLRQFRVSTYLSMSEETNTIPGDDGDDGLAGYRSMIILFEGQRHISRSETGWADRFVLLALRYYARASSGCHIRGQRGEDTANSVPRCNVIGFAENNKPGVVCRCARNIDGPKFRAPPVCCLPRESRKVHVHTILAVRHPLPAWCYRSTLANANFSAHDCVAEASIPPSGSVRKLDHSFRDLERISR